MPNDEKVMTLEELKGEYIKNWFPVSFGHIQPLSKKILIKIIDRVWQAAQAAQAEELKRKDKKIELLNKIVASDDDIILIRKKLADEITLKKLALEKENAALGAELGRTKEENKWVDFSAQLGYVKCVSAWGEIRRLKAELENHSDKQKQL